MSSTLSSLAASSSESADAPPPEDDWRSGGLPALRAELDRIDDAIHDLLMQRAGVVEHVARSGKPAAFRPGREASIIRRLLSRHQGSLPPVTLTRIWREMLAGTTAMQGGFSMAAGDTGTLSQLAREHFGALTPLRAFNNPGQAMTDVSQGCSSVAVLPFPTDDETWWLSLMNLEPRLHVIALLPFWRPRPEGAPAVRALVVASTPCDASGQDRSLLGLECAADISRTRLSGALAAAGLDPETMVVTRQPGSPIAHVLADVDGYLMDDDARLNRLTPIFSRPMILGSYATPVGGANGSAA